MLPSVISGASNIYEKSIRSLTSRDLSIDYKCALARKVSANPEAFKFKVGAVGSPAPGLQYVQGLGSAVVPGNITRYTNPLRSGTWSALTPGGSNRTGGILGRLGASVYGAVKPERGYRCPEGFQFGGQFTNEQYTTCGKQLFAIPSLLKRLAGQMGRSRGPSGEFQGSSVRRFVQLSVPFGTPISKRSADIPKVASMNVDFIKLAETEIYSGLAGVDMPTARLIRKDGFVLEPVVSAAVLRTVPDNRNMEDSVYAVGVTSPKQIGGEELGLLSNSGVSKIAYVMPNGGLIELGKNRQLTVGERRKLGKTVSAALKMNTSSDPAAKLRFVAGEMGDGMFYGEDLNMKNPNDLIRVVDSSGRKRVSRRWHHEAFARKKKPKTSETIAQVSTPQKEKLITDLASAVRHLNDSGNISRIAPSLRIQAMKRSRMYKSKKYSDSVNVFERGDGLTLFEISPSEDFEHLSARVASDVQQSLGIAAPEVYSAGNGKRAPYILTQAQDSFGRGSINRGSMDQLPVEDMIAIATADWLLDTRRRNPSNIQPVKLAGRLRAIPASNPGVALSGKPKGRTSTTIDSFFSEDSRDQWRLYFEKLRDEQKAQVLQLLSALIERARNSSIDEIISRIMSDGQISSSEKTHLMAVRGLYESRLSTLSSSRKSFIKILGIKK